MSFILRGMMKKLAGTYHIFALQKAHKGLMMSSQRGNEND
jgi:hypothetical protein